MALAVLICWILPARSPIWFDETGTYWIVKDDLASVIDRAYYWTNWSPYYLVEWFAVHLGGKNPFAMRLPSILAMGGAAWFMYRLASRIWDREAGLLTALVFVAMPDVAYAAADARPYAFTLLTLSAYAWVMLRWVDSGRIRDAIGAAVLAALTMYGHTVLALGLAGPAIFAVWYGSKRLHLLVAAFIACILVIPLAVQTNTYLAMNAPHIVGSRPTLDELWSWVAPPQFFATIGFGLLIGYVMLPKVRAEWGLPKSATLALTAWIVFGPAILFVLARTTEFRLFLPRYLLSSDVPLALLFGCIIRAVEPPRGRALVAVITMVTSVTAFALSAKSFHGDGWRDAMATVAREVSHDDTPVLIASPFVEAQGPQQMLDPRLKEALYAPEVFYPVPGRVIHLPYAFDEKYWEDLIRTQLAGEKEFLTLTYGDWTNQWLMRRLMDRGVESTDLGYFRGLRLYRYRLES